MDFSKYSNINKIVNKFGGVKKTVFNKKIFEKAEESWKQFTAKELAIIDSEIANVPQIYLSVVTSEAICIYNMHTFIAIPVKDIIWIYGSTVTQTMNFIPYNKIHTIYVMDRKGQVYSLGNISTFGMSKKKPNDERIEFIKNKLEKERKGIVYGYSKEIYDMFIKNLEKAVEIVDSNSKNV